MYIAYNPEEHQPLNIFFDINIGGLSKTYENPQKNIALTATLKSAPEFQLSLFDWTGFEVEPYLWMSSLQNKQGYPFGTLAWGYTQPDKRSPDYSIDYASYNVDVLRNSFMVDVHGTIALGPLVSNNQLQGTAQEIMDDFGKLHDLQVEIDPKFDPYHMRESGLCEIDDTKLEEMRHCKLMNENDWRYVQQILMYCRDSEGKGNYKPYITMDKSGNRMIKITKPRNMQADVKYDLADPASPVLRWKPEINFANIWGAYECQMNNYQRGSGDQQKVVLQQHLTEQWQDTMGTTIYPTVRSNPVKENATQFLQYNSERVEDQVKSSAIRMRTNGATSPYAGINPDLIQHLAEWSKTLEGTLVVVGDPTLRPPLNVEIHFWYPINYRNPLFQLEHYTSGIYHCDEVTHEISAGIYTTSLRVSRSGIFQSPQAKDLGNAGGGTSTGGSGS